MATKQQEAVLAELAKLGGQVVGNEDIRFEGGQFVIPEVMDLSAAARFLMQRVKAEEEYAAYQRTFNYRPWDVAYAVATTSRELFGGFNQLRTETMFGSDPPPVITINIGHEQTAQVPWGSMAVPVFEGTMQLFDTRNDYGLVGAIQIETKKRHAEAVEGFFLAVEAKLQCCSIYRGKAITGAVQPEFLDLASIDLSRVVYTAEVEHQLDANVLSMLRNADVIEALGLPLKRAVLMHGPYGTGKTLAAFRTAVEAVDSGWTFIYCRPGKDKLDEVLQTARLYQPAVVFFEDVDVIANDGDGDAVTKMLDMFDGITAKGTRLLAVMTTNHPDRIHKGMVRPGRLDAVIHIGHLDNVAIEQLVVASVPDSMMGEVDLGKVAVAMDGFLPAFVREAIDRAIRYAVARHDGQPDVLVTDDFVFAANGLRPQLEMMEGAGEGVQRRTIDDIVTEAAVVAVETAIRPNLLAKNN